MNLRERLLTIRLMRKLMENPDYVKTLGIEIKIVTVHPQHDR